LILDKETIKVKNTAQNEEAKEMKIIEHYKNIEEEKEYPQTIEVKESKEIKKKEKPEGMADNESLLSSDDEEINMYLLTEDEKKVKSIIWHKMNEEWLKEQEINKKKPVKKSVPRKPKDTQKPSRLFAEALRKEL